jgi:1-phosphatidylinositol-4-phosphate 5-kinase
MDEARRTPTDIVMQKAMREADRSKSRGANEEDIPDRRIGTVRSPSAERGELGSTLPVVEEAAESASMGGRSGRSGRSGDATPNLKPRPGPESNVNLTAPNLQGVGHDHRGKPPPTPPKDGRPWDANDDQYRPPTPPKDEKYRSGSPPTPPKDENSRGVNKDLPDAPADEKGGLANWAEETQRAMHV